MIGNNIKEKILTALLMIFGFLFLFYPTSDALVNLRAVFAFLLILWGVKRIRTKIRLFHIDEKYYIWIVIFCAVATRVGVVLWLEPYMTQMSDFQRSIIASKTLEFAGDYYRVFTHWILHPTIVNFIYRIFGESQLVALLFNALILIVAAVFIYKNASTLFGKKGYGLLAALIYLFWPANILYTLIFTQEHICVLLLQVIIYVFLKTESREDCGINYKKNLMYITIGILLGVSLFFKNFTPVFMLAFCIYYVLKGITRAQLKKYFVYKFVALMLIILSFSITKNALFHVVDDLVGEKVARDITACYLNVGLRGDGKYNAANYNMYFETLLENNYDYEKTNSQILEKLIREEKGNWSLDFFEKKAKTVVGGDSSRVLFVSESVKIGEHFRLAKILTDHVIDINNNYFTVLVSLMALGLVYMIRQKDLNVFLLYLICFGGLLLLLLVEAQNRYMYAMQPIICILAVLGIKFLKDTHSKK